MADYEPLNPSSLSPRSRARYAAIATVASALLLVLALSHPASPLGPARDPLALYSASLPRLRSEGADPAWYADRIGAGRGEFDWPSVDTMFVFGDSFTSHGSRYLETGIGDGHPAHTTGRTTNLKWADYLYNTFKSPDLTRYWNFGRDGATIDWEIVRPRLDVSGSLDQQLDEFLELFTSESAVAWTGEDSLFTLFMGINDMREMARREYPFAEQRDACHELPTRLMNRADRLYDAGARNFLFFTLPPLEEAPKYALPSEIGHNISHILAASTPMYNKALRAAAREFETEHDGSNTFVFDWDSLYRIIAAHPDVYGFTECRRYKMSKDGQPVDLGGAGFCWWDNSHMTWSIAQLIARGVHNLLLRHSRSFWTAEETENALVV